MATVEGVLDEAPGFVDGRVVVILDPSRIDGGPWREGWFYVLIPMTEAKRKALVRGFRRGSTVRVSGKPGRGLYGGNHPWLAGKWPLEKVKLNVDEDARPRRLVDPVLGTLEFDEAMGFTGWRKVDGSTYELSISEKVATDVKRARAVVQRTWKALRSVRAAAAKKLLPLYEKTWRGDGHSLSLAQFTKRISKLRSLQVERGGVTLIFDAGSLFADHGVQVKLSRTGAVASISLA